MKSIIKRSALLALFPLSIPLIGMMVSDEVQWGVFDFVFAFIFFTAFSTFYMLISQKIHNPLKQTLARMAIILAFLIIWAEIAVGIF